jgi:hypothetical protein
LRSDILYTKQVPFKDFFDKPRNATVNFNLTEREIFKLLAEFQAVFAWRDSMRGPERMLETQEVVDFYTAFEEILLSAYGNPSEDGLHFRKAGRYEFEESALFNACMVMFVTEPEETTKLIDGIMPSGMEEMVRKADANMAKAAEESNDDQLKAEILELRARIKQQEEGPAQA